MVDPIFEALEDIFEQLEIPDIYINAKIFQEALEECGYMIVPIEDPTNLRYGDE